MLGIGDYLWRLVPGNPILLRVVEASGKRKRDLFIRCGYLGLLVIVVCFFLLSGTSSTSGPLSLSDLSRASIAIFRGATYLQLGLVALLAPIFTAGAITQEKDSQTYDILLSTPLTNGQIVLGSLLSRLFFVIALLISGIPIFSATQIFGGVAISNVALSFGIAAGTAFVTGALAMAIATFKVGTRRTIFGFYMFIVIYLLGLLMLDQIGFFHRAGHDDAGMPVILKTSWLTGLNPFLAQKTINDLNYVPPQLGQLPASLRAWPIGWYLTHPAAFYIDATLLLSLVLVMPSIILLRRMAQSTSSFRSWLLRVARISRGDRTQKPRSVWHNPIAWREARTKASATRAWLLRTTFVLGGLGGAVILLVLMATPSAPSAQWIDTGSYDSTNRTLFIHGENKTYGLTDPVDVEIDDHKTDVSALTGHWALAEPAHVAETLGPRGMVMIDAVKLTRIPTTLDVNQARRALLGLSLLEMTVILLVVTNAAASTVTREKEDGTLDLLLATPITSRFYIWGKLRGLVSFVLPLVAVPAISAGLFVIYDFVQLIASRSTGEVWTVVPQAVLVMPAMLIILAAFASILGMQMSLRCRTTVRAVMSSLGIVLGVSGALSLCGYYALGTHGGATNFPGLIIASISPFTSMAMLLNPSAFGLVDAVDSGDAAVARWVVFATGWIVVAVYAGIVWSMYKSMVKNFDMTIRKQSR